MHSHTLNYMEMRHLNLFESCCTKSTNCLFHLVFLTFTLFAFSYSLLRTSAVICNSILCVMINGSSATLQKLWNFLFHPVFLCSFQGDHSVASNCSCFRNWEAAQIPYTDTSIYIHLNAFLSVSSWVVSCGRVWYWVI